jgi:hypothetical protein
LRLYEAPGNLIFPGWTIKEQPVIFLVRIHSVVNNLTSKNIENMNDTKTIIITFEHKQVASISLHDFKNPVASFIDSPDLDARPGRICRIFQEDDAAERLESASVNSAIPWTKIPVGGLFSAAW